MTTISFVYLFEVILSMVLGIETVWFCQEKSFFSVLQLDLLILDCMVIFPLWSFLKYKTEFLSC